MKTPGKTGRVGRYAPARFGMRTHYKPTETFQYTNFNSYHPVGVKKGFIKGEALRLLRTNSSKDMFDKNKKTFEHA